MNDVKVDKNTMEGCSKGQCAAGPTYTVDTYTQPNTTARAWDCILGKFKSLRRTMIARKKARVHLFST